MVCGTSSRFVHVSVVPAATDAVAGVKLKLSSTMSGVPVAGVSDSSGRSVIAIGLLTPWNDRRDRPSTLRRRSSDTVIGPGEGAAPGAGCGNAVDIAVWKVTYPSTFSITWWMWPLSTDTEPNRFK